jgi:hypothetical protein
MSPRPRKEKGPPPLEDLPSPLRMAIVKLMAKDNLDINEAYEKAANLIDINSPEFDKAVKKEGLRLYKQKFMREVNTARTTIKYNQDSKLAQERREGFDEGYAKGRDDHLVYYYCNVCRKRMDIYPNSAEHHKLVKYMYDHGWGHSSCHEKQKR